jgi:hypothetical protein
MWKQLGIPLLTVFFLTSASKKSMQIVRQCKFWMPVVKKIWLQILTSARREIMIASKVIVEWLQYIKFSAKGKQKIFYRISKEGTRAITFLEAKTSSSSSSRWPNGLCISIRPKEVGLIHVPVPGRKSALVQRSREKQRIGEGRVLPLPRGPQVESILFPFSYRPRFSGAPNPRSRNNPSLAAGLVVYSARVWLFARWRRRPWLTHLPFASTKTKPSSVTSTQRPPATPPPPVPVSPYVLSIPSTRRLSFD